MAWVSWLCIFLLLLPIPPFVRQSVAAADAKSGGPSTPKPATDDRDITLDVVVTDRSHTPIRGLQRQDFTVLDNKEPQPLTHFRAVDAGAPAAVEIVLVVDAVNADFLKTDRERDGIEKFLQMNGGKLAQPTSLVIFSDRGAQIQATASRDGNALTALLDQDETGLRTTNRSQGFYGAADRFQMSINAINSLAAFEAARPGRKLVIWISPGWPLLSQPLMTFTAKEHQQLFDSIAAASTQLRRARITPFNVETVSVAGEATSPFLFYYEDFLKGIKSPAEALPADLSLQVLAVQTGGRVLYGSNDLPSGIAAEIAQSAADASAFYVLSFQAPKADHVNEYHSLEVKVGRPDLTARTRTGYYAQP